MQNEKHRGNGRDQAKGHAHGNKRGKKGRSAQKHGPGSVRATNLEIQTDEGKRRVYDTDDPSIAEPHQGYYTKNFEWKRVPDDAQLLPIEAAGGDSKQQKREKRRNHPQQKH